MSEILLFGNLSSKFGRELMKPVKKGNKTLYGNVVKYGDELNIDKVDREYNFAIGVTSRVDSKFVKDCRLFNAYNYGSTLHVVVRNGVDTSALSEINSSIIVCDMKSHSIKALFGTLLEKENPTPVVEEVPVAKE